MSLCENPLRPFSVGNRCIVQNRLDLKDAPFSNETSYQMHAGMQGRVVSLGSNPISEAGIPTDCIGSWRWNIGTNAMTWSGELYSIVGRDQNSAVPSFKAHSCFYTADSWVQLLSATLVLLNTGQPYGLSLQMLHADGTRRRVIVKGEAVCDQFGHVLEVCGTVANINERTLVAGDRELRNHARGGHEPAARLIDAQDKQDIQIARSLRDNVSQRVSLLAASIQDLSLTAAELSPQNLLKLDELWRYTTGILSELDGICEHLHSASLDLLGLTFAVQSLCQEFRVRSGILVEYECANVGVEKLDDQLVLTLFCVLKEALDNVARHSRATRCTVTLSQSSGEIVLQVMDNGVGFQPTELDTSSGLGFLRINERLFQIGGSLAVGSALACGTSIEVRVPLNHASGETRQNTVATAFDARLRVFTQCSI